MTAFVHSNLVLACAACYGQNDSSMAQGMNWGIVALLGVTISVLATIAGFFIYLSRRAVSSANDVAPRDTLRSTLDPRPYPAPRPTTLAPLSYGKTV